jgi:hypothetical protein
MLRQNEFLSLKSAKSIEEINPNEKCLWDISDELYSSVNALRHSSLSKIFPPKTPLDFAWQKQFRKDFKTSAMEFGTALHLMLFQPDIFEDRICVEPEVNKRTNAGKEEYAAFVASAAGKIVLSKKELDDCYYIQENLSNHPIGNLLAKKTGIPEVSGFFPWRDTMCKFRADYIIPDKRVIFDLKTTLAGHESSFRNSVSEYSYHTQAYFYLTGLSYLTGQTWEDFVWIAVEKTAPYKIYLHQPEKKWLDCAAALIDKSIRLIEKCEKEKKWPGPSQNVETLFAPAWMDVNNI